MSGPLDIGALRAKLEGRQGRAYWRSLEEAAADGDFEEALKAEFPSQFEYWQTNRRELLRVMGASLALAGVAGCSSRRSDEAIPYVNRPEDMVEDRDGRYATAILFDGYAQPVVATTHAGRPTKLEGNPDHPASRGATSLHNQAAILDLYDPDRSQAPLLKGEAASWSDLDALMARLRRQWTASGGAGLALLIGPTSSPTLVRQLGELAKALPNARIYGFDPLEDFRRAATSALFRRPLDILPDLSRARVVVSLDDDLLGPGPAQVPNVRAWASRRGEKVAASERIRLFMAETTPTQTGAAALRRLAIVPSRLPLIAAAVAFHLGAGDAPEGGLSPQEAGWAADAARALAGARGASLVSAGAHATPAVQALAFRLNEALGNVGNTIHYAEPILFSAPTGSLVDLARAIVAKQVGTLVTLDANPLYAAPADLGFAALYRRIPLTIHAGTHADETAAASHWHLPLPHSLEDWTDGRAVDGNATIVQPLVEPLYDSRSIHSLVASLTGDAFQPPRDIVRATWPALDDKAWHEALRSGLVPNSAAAPVAAKPAAALGGATAPAGGEVEILFRPDPTIRDGRYANNAWLQELGKPLFKTTWENVVAISPAFAETLGAGNGDRLRVTSGGRSVEGPAWILPGQPEKAVTLFLGYGRRNAGRVGDGIGYDAYAIRTAAAPWSAPGEIEKLPGRKPIAVTQQYQAIDAEGADLVRTVAAASVVAEKPEETDRASFYPAWEQEEPAWAMAIDLDLCTGCNACAIACQAENNVPVVGQDQVRRGRHMHWLRVDLYHAGGLDHPDTMFQPVPCMHCEQAPCEMGCPVHATVHSPDGLNEMIYNRCIGTRTCSSYCPYKVRRFNWFDYTSKAPASIQAQRNPDVTVRGRGVMEKCTYCVQRIRGAAVDADKEDRPIREGEMVTACQQACPSEAIVFGNMKDPNSAVARLRRSARNYSMLGELDTRPRTTYLARLSDRTEG
ncbi:MAG TPA: TAT-variant-translocated molybdopterin oxidoreductase [Allosphingosinicella sp.]|nr:TAT-variant-translocated molybdopterin oxidoreductase [Allosphingosinicella sp.]